MCGVIFVCCLLCEIETEVLCERDPWKVKTENVIGHFSENLVHYICHSQTEGFRLFFRENTIIILKLQ